MLPFAFYLLKVIICSGVLIGYYWLLLRNKIYHRYNRFYLLATVVLSLTMPLIQINILHKAGTPAESIKLLKVVTGSNEYLDEIVVTARQNNFTAEQVALLLYIVICLIFCTAFILVLLKIRTLLKLHQQTVVDNICFVNTTAKGTPFSFLNYIFWNDNININTTTGNQIFKHELAHVQQKHSYDKLFINATLIFFWCNPFFWLVRKELNMIHEFMADKIAVENSDTEAFAAMILQATYPQHRFALTNPFFYSPIKRRLFMLTKNNHTKAGYIGRVLVLPLAVLLFAAFTLKTKTIINTPIYQGKKITVVLDAGHGGRDFGATSIDGKIREKDLTLSIIKKIKELNTNDNINIILTRETDIYQSPMEKVDFSKSQNSDLFISIHLDAIHKEKTENTHSGISVWIAKDNFTNAAGSKLFASAIINEFNINYGLPILFSNPQQRINSVWILQESRCPAVLIEAGIINNKTDLAYLQTDEAKEAIARNVLAAIEKYATQNTKEANDLPSVLIDTVPNKKVIQNEHSTTKKIKSDKYLLPENTLYILDGKIIGTGKVASDKIDKLMEDKQNNIIEVSILKKEQAQIKYGKQAKDEAVEIITSSKNANLINKEKINTLMSDEIKNHAVSISEESIIFTQVENEPKFPGGDSAWRRYLVKNLNPGIPVANGAPDGTYKVIVKFIVNKDGSISDVQAETKHGYGMDSAAVALIKKGPKWLPALQNGHNVTAYKKQPITFMLVEQK